MCSDIGRSCRLGVDRDFNLLWTVCAETRDLQTICHAERTCRAHFHNPRRISEALLAPIRAAGPRAAHEVLLDPSSSVYKKHAEKLRQEQAGLHNQTSSRGGCRCSCAILLNLRLCRPAGFSRAQPQEANRLPALFSAPYLVTHRCSPTLLRIPCDDRYHPPYHPPIVPPTFFSG